MVASTTLAFKFERNCTPEPNSGCWLWTGEQQKTDSEWSGSAYGAIQQVTEIRSAYQKGKRGYGARETGKRFSISPSEVLRIVRHEAWK